MRHALIVLLATLPLPALAQELAFGDDSGGFARDGECDDARFAGPGMASSIDTAGILADATDCEALFQANRIRLVRQKGDTDVAECAAIDFGDDGSDWARDGECDDPRFTGMLVDDVLNADDAGRDATDCKALCEAGEVWLR